MPPNGKPYAMNLFKNVLYTHSAQGCGGNPNVVYAYDLATHKVGSWGPAGGGMWGRTGPAISSKGVMYTGTGDGRWDPENGLYGNGIIGVQQDPKTKSAVLVDYFGPTNAERNGPWSAADVVVARTEQCQCLYQRQCSRGASCIDEIPFEEVMAAVVQRVGADG